MFAYIIVTFFAALGGWIAFGNIGIFISVAFFIAFLVAVDSEYRKPPPVVRKKR